MSTMGTNCKAFESTFPSRLEQDSSEVSHQAATNVFAARSTQRVRQPHDRQQGDTFQTLHFQQDRPVLDRQHALSVDNSKIKRVRFSDGKQHVIHTKTIDINTISMIFQWACR